jgi:ribosomal protein L37E
VADERLATKVSDPRPWHQRSPYAGVKDDPAEIIVLNDRVTRGVNKTLTREAWEEVRIGRRCIRCEEPQLKEEFPKQCSLCGFPMKEHQMRYFERLFQGEEWVGSTIDWRAELDRMDDELERDNFADHPTSGIVIPRGVQV